MKKFLKVLMLTGMAGLVALTTACATAVSAGDAETTVTHSVDAAPIGVYDGDEPDFSEQLPATPEFVSFSGTVVEVL